jgi:hypothetical protein
LGSGPETTGKVAYFAKVFLDKVFLFLDFKPKPWVKPRFLIKTEEPWKNKGSEQEFLGLTPMNLGRDVSF